MPKVGTKKFAYTAKGNKAAKAYAKKTGKKLKSAKKLKKDKPRKQSGAMGY